MDEPLKKSATLAERRKRAKTGPTSAKLRARPGRPARSEAAAAPAAGLISLPSEAKSLMPSAALIGVGLLLESELLVGIAMGTGIMVASRWLPETVGGTLEPVVNDTVKACYSAAAKTSQILGEAVQRVESILTRQAPSEEEAAAVPRAKVRRRAIKPQA